MHQDSKIAPKAGPKAAPKASPKASPKRAPAMLANAARRTKLTEKVDLTKRPKGFHHDRLYRREYSKLIHQTTVVDELKLTSLDDLLKAKEVVVVTTSGEKFGMLPLTASTRHIRPYALEVLRSVTKEFYEKSGGYQLLVSSLFRSPDQQIKEAKKNPTAIKPSSGASTHLFGNTFDFTITRFLGLDGKHTLGMGALNARLTRILDQVLISHQRRGLAMGYWEKAARHIVAAKPAAAKVTSTPVPKPVPPAPKPVPPKPKPLTVPLPKPPTPDKIPDAIETQKTVDLPVITRQNALGATFIDIQASAPKWEADGWKVEPFQATNGNKGVRLKRGTKSATIINLRIAPGTTSLTLPLQSSP